MGDKNPKSKQREKEQKTAVKSQGQAAHDKKQTNFASAPTLEKGKKK